MKIFSYWGHYKKCHQNEPFWAILVTFLIMSLKGQFLYYWSYKHDILPSIVGSNTVQGKTLVFEQYTHKFSIFRKACLPGPGCQVLVLQVTASLHYPLNEVVALRNKAFQNITITILRDTKNLNNWFFYILWNYERTF